MNIIYLLSKSVLFFKLYPNVIMSEFYILIIVNVTISEETFLNIKYWYVAFLFLLFPLIQLFWSQSCTLWDRLLKFPGNLKTVSPLDFLITYGSIFLNCIMEVLPVSTSESCVNSCDSIYNVLKTVPGK